jgi:hypothetical protein
MNQRLSDKLSTFPESLSKAKSKDEVNTAVVEIERLVLKSNFEDHQNSVSAAYEAQDYTVGEANTRGLDWKIRLLRVLSNANFCYLQRLGVHGGQTQVIGQPENIDVTFQIYNALIPAYEAVSVAAFEDFLEGNSKEEGAAKPHKAGWINKFLVEVPAELGEKLHESQEKDAGTNGKLAAMIASKKTELQEYQKTLTPPRIERTPRAKKAPKASESETDSGMETETTSENVVDGNTPAEIPEGDTAELARAEAAQS